MLLANKEKRMATITISPKSLGIEHNEKRILTKENNHHDGHETRLYRFRSTTNVVRGEMPSGLAEETSSAN